MFMHVLCKLTGKDVPGRIAYVMCCMRSAREIFCSQGPQRSGKAPNYANPQYSGISHGLPAEFCVGAISTCKTIEKTQSLAIGSHR